MSQDVRRISIPTPRFQLDRLIPADAPAVFAYRSLPAVGAYQSFVPQSLADVDRFIGRQPEAFGTPDTWFQLAIRDRAASQLVGDAGVHFVGEHQAELGVTVAPDHQGQGVATEVVEHLLAHLFGTLQKHRVTASIDPRNVPSMRLFERVGMRQEAHHRQSLWFKDEWVDDVVFAVLRTDWAGASRGA